MRLESKALIEPILYRLNHSDIFHASQVYGKLVRVWLLFRHPLKDGV